MNQTGQEAPGQAMRAPEAHYRALFDAIDEGFCVCQVLLGEDGQAHDYTFLAINPAFVAMTGFRDAVGRTARELAPALDPFWPQTYGRVAETGMPTRIEYWNPVRQRWFDVYTTRFGGPDERTVAVLFTDITARKEAELERERLLGQLQEQDRRKDEFLATLAHELRNPLAPLRNGLQILKLTAGDPAAMEQARTMMERQLGQMVRLIDDLMDMSRISRGKVELRMERAELATAVLHAVETSRPLIEASGHTLTVRMAQEPIHVDADVTRLAQVIANLLNNAAKYTEPGGQVSLSVDREDGEALIRVRDTGVGIPAPMLPRVFDMFSQVDRSLERSQGGLGIGLSLVKRLVELHGGAVEAHSEGHGKGSEFVVRLPVAPAGAGSRLPEPSADASGRPPLRVLVVDDNRDAALSLATMLSIMGHDTRTAHDGLEALALAESFRPQLALLDLGMPRLNGYDTCRRIREQPWGQGMGLVALTGWGQEEDKRRSHEAGFDGHMVKPVDPGALEALLASWQPAGA